MSTLLAPQHGQPSRHVPPWQNLGLNSEMECNGQLYCIHFNGSCILPSCLQEQMTYLHVRSCSPFSSSLLPFLVQFLLHPFLLSFPPSLSSSSSPQPLAAIPNTRSRPLSLLKGDGVSLHLSIPSQHQEIHPIKVQPDDL